jgi:hypothetical protein
VEEYLLLGIALFVAGAAVVAGVIFYETSWKTHRQRRIERNHARSKLSKRA